MSPFLPRRFALEGEQATAMKSRVNREVHARFCEGLGVKFPGATRPPGTRQLEFLCLDWSMRASADSALLENSRRDRRSEPIVRTVPFILSAEDQGILGLSRKLEK